MKQKLLPVNTIVSDIDPMDEIQLKENLEKLKDRFRNADKTNTKERYAIAREFHDFCNSVKDWYGAKVMERFAEITGYSLEKLRLYRLVAQTWSREKIEAICERKNKFGMPVSWSHLTILAQIDGQKERDEWLDEVLQEGFSVRKLKANLTNLAATDEEIAALNAITDMEGIEDRDPYREDDDLMIYSAEFDEAEDEDRLPEAKENVAEDGATEDLAPEPSATETKGDHVRDFDSCLRRLIGATDGATENARNLWSKFESLLKELDSEQITGDRRLQIERARDKLYYAAELDKKAAQALDDFLKQEEPVAEQVTAKRPARRTKSSAA